MSNVSFGTNISVQKKRVKFINTNSSAAVTLYEGMPFCYQFDTTTNILGYDKEAGGDSGCQTSPTTTAEGYQNEGKFLIVDLPDADNIHAFAGVLAGSSYAGKSIADDGEQWVDIYEPNGAIVPVRTDASTTVGVTVLGIASGSTLCASGGRPVAVAWETVDRSETNGITLAKLDPDMFLYQKGDAQALSYVSLTGAVANTLQNTFANTSGSACNVLVHTTVSGDLAAAHNEWGILNYVNVSGSITANGITRALLSQLNIDGTINGGAHLAAIHAQLTGAPTLTAGEHMSCLWVDGSITGIDNGGDPSSAIEYNLIKMTNNGGSEDIIGSAFYIYGGYGIDKLFKFDTCINGGGADEHFISNGGDGSAEKGIATTNGWKKVKCDIDGTSYYLILYHTPTEVDMVS